MGRMMKHTPVLVAALAFWTLTAWTQQKDPRVSSPVQAIPPLATGESTSRSGADADSATTSTQAPTTPDNRPLTGVQPFTLGTSGGRPSILYTRLHFEEFADSNPKSSSGGGTRIDTVSRLSGEIALQRLWTRYELDLIYAGGGSLYRSATQFNNTFHSLGLVQRFNWGRWDMLVLDQASYLPESSFGFGGPGSFGAAGSGLTGVNGQAVNLNPTFGLNQTIFTGIARRFANSAVGQVQYSLSPSSSITTSVSYGMLHFLDPGFFDNNQLVLRSGYNHRMGRQNTVGVFYQYSRFGIRGSTQKVVDQSFRLAYGRRITGRMALQLNAGPRVSTFQNMPGRTDPRVSWGMGANLSYQRVRDSFGVRYHHGASGGSGLLLGATNDLLQGDYTRQLTRSWTGTMDVGFARNASLGIAQTGLVASSEYRSMYAGGSVSHPLGRQMHFSVWYRLLRLSTENSACPAGSCGTLFLRHHFGLNLDWSLRPIILE